jgi:hypothetical protein
MSSQSRATRENQKKLYDERLQARQTVLEKRGIAANEFKKDKVFQQLKAKHQAITKAIAAIDASLARKEPLVAKDETKKPAPAPAPTEKKQKKEKPEKAAKAAPADSKE